MVIEEEKSIRKVKSTARIHTSIGPWTSNFSDISKHISANTKIFVDDTNMKDSINNEDDVEKLQTGKKSKSAKLEQKWKTASPDIERGNFQINGARLLNCLPKKAREIIMYQDEFE